MEYIVNHQEPLLREILTGTQSDVTLSIVRYLNVVL